MTSYEQALRDSWKENIKTESNNSLNSQISEKVIIFDKVLIMLQFKAKTYSTIIIFVSVDVQLKMTHGRPDDRSILVSISLFLQLLSPIITTTDRQHSFLCQRGVIA